MTEYKTKKFKTFHLKKVNKGWILQTGLTQRVFVDKNKLLDWIFDHS